jgi:fatty acid desaturase (delta-4 desaturase)
VYRGKAYNLTPYMDRHPGGNWLINLAIGRDCTALFESYHLRPEVAGEAHTFNDCVAVS